MRDRKLLTITRAATVWLGCSLHNVAMADVMLPGSDFSAGQFWSGGAYQANGTFSYCAIGGKYNGTTLIFGITKEFDDFMISLANTSWRLPKGQILYADISLDGGWSGTYKGLVADKDQITFHFHPDADFVKAIAIGRTLRINTSKDKWQFNLIGTERAVPQLVKCVIAYSTPGTSNPFDYSAEQTRPSNPFDTKR